MLSRLSAVLVLLAAGSGMAIGYVLLFPGMSDEAPPCPEETAASLQDEARAAFSRGTERLEDARQAREEFARAADALDRMCRLCPSADGYHDLGNACLLADRLPEAIFAFRRGLVLNPNDARLRRHLHYARLLVPYGPAERGKPPEDFWPLWLPRPRTLLGWGALAAHALSLILFTRSGLGGRVRPFVLACLMSAAALTLGGAWFILGREPPLVVIAQKDLPLRQGNGPSYPPHPHLPVLARGMEASFLGKRGDWLFLQFATGEVGWVPAEGTLIAERIPGP